MSEGQLHVFRDRIASIRITENVRAEAVSVFTRSCDRPVIERASNSEEFFLLGEVVVDIPIFFDF
jgi:hypothetical protein